MFQIPTSSPMMTTMFGCLPSFWAAADTFALWAAIAASAALSAPAQQPPSSGPSVGVAAGGADAAPVLANGLNLPDAAAYPAVRPTASTRAVWILDPLNMATSYSNESFGNQSVLDHGKRA